MPDSPIVQTDAKPAARKLGVLIVTPVRQYRDARDLPPQIGRALKELVTRGTIAERMESRRVDPGPEELARDVAFRAEADKYHFEFAAAVGGVIRARNAAVNEALKDDSIDFVLMWDSDIFPDDPALAVLRLLSHRQPIVGALYCRRGNPPVYVTTFFPDAKFEPNANGLIQVVELGTGMKLFHRKVFTELVRLAGKELAYIHRDTGSQEFAFFQHGVVEGDELSEEYFLDYLCRKHGIGILADTQLKVWHVDHDGVRYPENGNWPPIPALESENVIPLT